MRHIVVVGGGFAGVWSAVGAARVLRQSGRTADPVAVTVISRDAYLTIRPRLYEADPTRMRIPLDGILAPVGVQRVEGVVKGIDFGSRRVVAAVSDGVRRLPYDRLVLAAGSQLHRSDTPGLADYAFSIDTYDDAVALDRHLASLPTRPAGPGRYTAVVVGSGSTGIETATEIVARLRRVAVDTGEVRVVIVERQPRLAPYLGDHARQVVAEALRRLGIEALTGTAVAAIRPDAVALDTGEVLAAATTVWTGGLRASPLTSLFAASHDALGRLPVDEHLRVQGMDGIFAAGDVARARTDPEHYALMTCQHAIPQGKVAGHNAARDLLALPMVPYEQRRYVMCVDLGTAGAVYTDGWDRVVVHRGLGGKHMKHVLVRFVIYPPASAQARDILRAADVQAFRRDDRASRKGLYRWLERTIPPACVHFSFRLLTGWSAVSRMPRTWFRRPSYGARA